jgi:hypothetical protein
MTADELSRRAALKVLVCSTGVALASPALSDVTMYQPKHFTQLK